MAGPSAQSRNTTSSSRLISSSKSNAWGSNNPPNSQSIPQSQDSSSSWAQAMNPRPNTQLDLSSSSFPSLAGGGGQSHTPGVPSSQWQAGPPPPPRDESQPQSQNSRIIQQRQQPLSARRDEGFANDFSSLEQSSARFQSHTRGAPPGLAPVDGMSPDSSVQARKTPISQGVNGSIGQERANGEATSESATSAMQTQSRLTDAFPPREQMSDITQQDQSLESIFSGMSEKDKWGIAGWHALHDGPAAESKALSRQGDMSSFEHYAASGQPLLRSYAGPFAPPNAFAPRPLDTDYTIPDCYIVHNVAPIQQRISGFTEDTLFYIFYTSPKDIIQEEVATELMSRKWRFHMGEKMWLTRDDTTNNPVILEKDVCEQGYYIWWDFRNWKRIRKMYILRYEDLDDHLSGGRSLAMPGLFQGGIGMMGAGGMNGGGGNGSGAAGSGFNAVPGLERMAALGGGRF
ncbi:transcriptional regulator [Exophiala xenobiotica]|uniref:Transcriptional regulator n=1 Tax=Lithohypha guttulata TaxID=1690604 RepID=A0ABR0KDH3_9EURO|nr:transcriptional regulator [Lithohypha guttulata]KAK5320851.1 transcriptional regulator [Exophiala xenobiotica]